MGVAMTVARVWGLTGTPAPNGYMDLFGQFLILDDGAALGRFITHYRDTYFQADWNGFDYVLQPGGAKRIETRIEPYVLQMSAEDYLELPPVVDDARMLDMDKASRATYVKMKRDMLAQLPEGVVTGANAAATYAKLSQMANGAVYMGDTQKTVAPIHEAKLEALDSLIEELAGAQLLVAYEFQHDLSRLKDRYGDKLATLAGVSEAKANEVIAAWNAGKISLLACHPASAAHGLNLQYSSCAHVAWFSPTWDLELYQQFIRRIRRQGNDAQRIFNHLLIVRDTIDEIKLQALADKDMTQDGLRRRMTVELQRDAENPASGEELERKERLAMAITKLSRQAPAGEVPAQTVAPLTATQAALGPAPVSIVPKGWPGAGAPPVQATLPPATQPERIQQAITGQLPAPSAPAVPLAAAARSAFSAAVQTQAAAIETAPVAQPAPPMPTAAEVMAHLPLTPLAQLSLPPSSGDTIVIKRTRTRKAEQEPSPFTNKMSPADKVALLAVVFGPCACESVEDGLALATELAEWIEAD